MAALNQCIFRKKSRHLSSVGPKILAFGSHCSAKFQSIFDCAIRNFKLKHEDSENIKTYRVNTVIFKLHQIKQRNFLGTRGTYSRFDSESSSRISEMCTTSISELWELL